jgi:hypothetical protein
MKDNQSDEHLNLIERSVMVSKNVRKAWEDKMPWDDDLFVKIQHMGFAIKEADFWITKNESEELSLPTNRILSDDETETFLDWTDGKTSGILLMDFENWKNNKA